MLNKGILKSTVIRCQLVGAPLTGRIHALAELKARGREDRCNRDSRWIRDVSFDDVIITDNVISSQNDVRTKLACALECQQTRKIVNGLTIQLHRFPANVILKRSWLRRIKLVYGNYSNSNNDRLCSVHFPGGRKTKINNIPSIFEGKTFRTLTSTTDDNTDIHLNAVQEADPTNPDNINDLRDNYEPGPVLQTDDSALNTSVRFHDYFGPVYCTQTDFVHILSEPLQPIPHILNTVNHIALQTMKPDITIEDIGNRDDKVMFYTGVPNGATFALLFNEMHDMYDVHNERKGGRPRNLRLIDEFFMVLVRLRLGLLIEDLADRFKISKGTCSVIISRWVNYLHIKLSFLLVWPTRQVNLETMPKQFKSKYPNCRVIIDCTELFTQTPQSPNK
ncbi:uncharacterized protein LOC121389298 [Gigantopelta aegis]|uniref:uncharacterized protein LOC121389298 n=1 Tax=Gigantopelta aegis TaxID=1735272 RepID=UPI001B887B6D|nr:uncharacterized protein LOC121389298 [Gigantopelta aegis]